MWTLICLAAIFTADVDSVLRSKRAVKTESYQQLGFQENKSGIFFPAQTQALIPQSTYVILQSSWFNNGTKHPVKNAADGDVNTWSHSSCLDKPWVKIHLKHRATVSKIIVINGNWKHPYNTTRNRINGAFVETQAYYNSMPINSKHICGSIVVGPGNTNTLKNQTYELDCDDSIADAVTIW